MAQSASLYQDHILQAVLQGNLTSVPDPPARILKLVLSSSKTGKCNIYYVRYPMIAITFS